MVVCGLMAGAFYFIVLGTVIVPAVQLGPFDDLETCRSMQLTHKGKSVTACWEHVGSRIRVADIPCELIHRIPQEEEEEPESES